MALNGISTLLTKELRQKAKLDLAASNRLAVGNSRSTYDITQLPTQYAGNTVVDNPNIGGLIAGRPWIETVVDSYITSPNLIGTAVTVEEFSPFDSGNSYKFSSSVNSYLSFDASEDWAVGTSDFTVEWFSYQTTLDQFQRVFTVGDYPNISFGVSIESGTFYYWANSSFRYSASSASTTNTWYHWAVVRQSGVTKIYRNGALLGSQITDTNNITNSVTNMIIGNTNAFATNAAMVGYLTNFRWVNGLAVYTGNFTVPTSPLSATQVENPYGGTNTSAIPAGKTVLLLNP